jgi:prepilin-type N-terminal cleavage/methylation domain-containing protein
MVNKIYNTLKAVSFGIILYWRYLMLCHSKFRLSKKGFTLIELLIVIAIILILIAIALPNFLEAQIRARVTKSMGEMRTLMTATEAYRIDWKNQEPYAAVPPGWGISWWGFTSLQLTTPNAYISSLPSDPFFDRIFEPSLLAFGMVNPPYTVIRDSGTATWPPPGIFTNNPEITTAAGGPTPIPVDFHQKVCHAGYIYYSSGPDLVDGSVWGTPMIYAPTNGTNSFGDLYIFGPGDPLESLQEWMKADPNSSMPAVVRANCGL